MILCDVNVWLALALSSHRYHRAARDWFDSVREPGAALFCRATQQAFLRLLTNAAVLAPYGNPPLTNAQAWRAYADLTADDRVNLLTQEPPDLESRWKRYAIRDVASPKLWMDAYLAAYASGAGLQLVTTDDAFSQFRGLHLQVLS